MLLLLISLLITGCGQANKVINPDIVKERAVVEKVDKLLPTPTPTPEPIPPETYDWKGQTLEALYDITKGCFFLCGAVFLTVVACHATIHAVCIIAPLMYKNTSKVQKVQNKNETLADKTDRIIAERKKNSAGVPLDKSIRAERDLEYAEKNKPNRDFVVPDEVNDRLSGDKQKARNFRKTIKKSWETND